MISHVAPKLLRAIVDGMDLPHRKGFFTIRSVSFEVALFEDRLKKSCSCSMKWCSLSYSKDRIRARAPSSTEQEYEHEKPGNGASRIHKWPVGPIQMPVCRPFRPLFVDDTDPVVYTGLHHRLWMYRPSGPAMRNFKTHASGCDEISRNCVSFV